MTYDVSPLRRVAAVVNGGTPTSESENWDGGVPWATPVDLGKARILTGTGRTLTERGVATGSRAVPGESVIVSSRAPIGYVSITSRRTAFNQGCKGLVPYAGTNGRFLAYALESMRPAMQAAGQGSTFMELSSDALASLSCPTPPLEEQRRIADFLDAETARIDRLVELRREQRLLWRQRLVTQRKELVANLGATYGWVPLGRCTRSLDGRRVPLNREERGSRNGPYPYWGAGSVVDWVDAYLFNEPVVLLGEDGAPFFDDKRDVAFAERRKVWVNNHIHVLRPLAGWRVDFLAHALNAVDYGRYISGTTRDKLTQEEMVQIRLPLTPAPQQAEVVALLDATQERAAHFDAAASTWLNRMNERRQALITAGVTGQLDVSTAGRAA